MDQHVRPLAPGLLWKPSREGLGERGWERSTLDPSLRASRGDSVRSESLRIPGMSLGICTCCLGLRREGTVVSRRRLRRTAPGGRGELGLAPALRLSTLDTERSSVWS